MPVSLHAIDNFFTFGFFLPFKIQELRRLRFFRAKGKIEVMKVVCFVIGFDETLRRYQNFSMKRNACLCFGCFFAAHLKSHMLRFLFST